MSINVETLLNSLDLNLRLGSDYIEKSLLSVEINYDHLIAPIPNEFFLKSLLQENIDIQKYIPYHFETLPEFHCAGKLCESIDNQWVCGC